MVFFHSVPHSPCLRFISRAFAPVNQMFTRGGGAPDFTRRTLVFLLLDFGIWGSEARRMSAESKGGKCAIWENQPFKNTECFKITVFE